MWRRKFAVARGFLTSAAACCLDKTGQIIPIIMHIRLDVWECVHIFIAVFICIFHSLYFYSFRQFLCMSRCGRNYSITVQYTAIQYNSHTTNTNFVKFIMFRFVETMIEMCQFWMTLVFFCCCCCSFGNECLLVSVGGGLQGYVYTTGLN